MACEQQLDQVKLVSWGNTERAEGAAGAKPTVGACGARSKMVRGSIAAGVEGGVGRGKHRS